MSILLDVIGIFVGHIYYHLVYVYPEITGRHLLKTPRLMYVLNDFICLITIYLQFNIYTEKQCLMNTSMSILIDQLYL